MSCPASRVSPRSSWRRQLGWISGGLAMLAVAISFRYYAGDSPATAQTPRDTRRPARAQGRVPGTSSETPRREYPEHDVMAIVNGKDISRVDLEQACIWRYGEEVLESLVNKQLVRHHCQKRGIKITAADIDAEIDRMSKRFGLPRDQYLSLLRKERGIGEDEYRRDILWPMLAMRRLAKDQMSVSEQEIRAAYESQYGEAVQARLIVLDDRQQAEELQADLRQNPDDFARAAVDVSVDVNSASIGGLIQPIRRHVGEPQVEQAIFSLAEGEVSGVIPIAQQYAIFRCERHIPPRNVPFDSVRDAIVSQLKEDKLRAVAAEKFTELQAAATVVNVYNDPSLRNRHPGVVALVNGDPIKLSKLGDECMLRHGNDVLQLEIHHLLLFQALERAGIQVTDEDVNAEIAHAAILAEVTDAIGRPDMQRWLEMVTTEQGVSQQIYIRDSVWPSAALKKLTSDAVVVTQEDLQRAFEANYGERVRCRAIILANQRQATRVFEAARKNPTVEHFGQLAAEHSIEPTTKSLEGEVPPIQRHGGKPQLEEVAFALQPGEISPIVNLGDNYVILYCEGRTERHDFQLEEVREILYRDVQEKKLRLAMAEKMEEILVSARVDNYLAGTSQSPDTPQATASGRHDDSVVRQAAGTQLATPRR